MKNNFEVYKLLPSGIPVSIQRGEDLENAIRSAIAFAVHVPGHYIVCAERNAFEPILDLDYFESFEIAEENECQTRN